MRTLRNCITVGICGFLVFLLIWNYLYNVFNKNNIGFYTFQLDSENFVICEIKNREKGVEDHKYGLCSLVNNLSFARYLTNDKFYKGYSKTKPELCFRSTGYIDSVVKKNNYIKFNNGKIFLIKKVKKEGNFLVASLDTTKKLTYKEYGILSEVKLLDKDKKELPKEVVTVYNAQYGLQGRVFNAICRAFDYKLSIKVLKKVCAILTAIVLFAIVWIIYKKYNLKMAICFYFTFLLSQWIVNYARNLYWVEFTWFIPMLVGLICSWKIKSRKCRVISYILAFVSILIKCLCGYEFITVIMLGLISFLVIDLIMAILNKNIVDAKVLLKTVIIIGLMALLGFVVAICMHGYLRGDGDVFNGIKSIYREDVLRRTLGGDSNDFDKSYKESINASILVTLGRYFSFSTEIVSGMTRHMFIFLCLIPIILIIYNAFKRRIYKEWIVMYLVFFVTCISWFVLGKAHSYVHIHMNYVLWYFGYVQICFYIILENCTVVLKKIVYIIKHKN